jgi:hypothetical protein
VNLAWIPFYFDAGGARDAAGRNFALRFREDWQRMKDFQRGWFMELLIQSLRSKTPGYLEVSRENLWKLAGAHRRDHFERNASELVSCFQIAQVSGRESRVFYEPLALVVEQQTRKLKARLDDLPDQEEFRFSEVSTDIHSGRAGPLSLSGFDFGVASKKQKVRSEKAAPVPRPAFTIPTVKELAGYCCEHQLRVDPERFFNYYSSNGWRVGSNPMTDWRAALRSWECREFGDDVRRKPGSRSAGAGNCDLHPNSGLTASGACWGCYVRNIAEEGRSA